MCGRRYFMNDDNKDAWESLRATGTLSRGVEVNPASLTMQEYLWLYDQLVGPKDAMPDPPWPTKHKLSKPLRQAFEVRWRLP